MQPVNYYQYPQGGYGAYPAAYMQANQVAQQQQYQQVQQQQQQQQPLYYQPQQQQPYYAPQGYSYGGVRAGGSDALQDAHVRLPPVENVRQGGKKRSLPPALEARKNAVLAYYKKVKHTGMSYKDVLQQTAGKTAHEIAKMAKGYRSRR